MSDTTHTLLRSASRFFSGTMLSRITGLLRDMAMAYAFGTQSAIAALLVAFRFAHLLRRLLGEGAMQTALIPHFEELRKEDPKRAGQFFCDLAFSLSHLLFFLIAGVMLCIGGLLAMDILNPGNSEIAWLTLLMMPSLLFICLFGINASLLQCEKSYFAPSAAPVFFNLFWIIGVLCTGHMVPATAMTYLSVFIIIACFAQWAITLPQTYKIIKSYGINSAWKTVKCYSSDVLKLAKPLSLGIIGVGAAQINNALDAVFARWANEEGPALLWYAIRLQQLPLALFGVAIAGAILPPLSRAIKSNDLLKFRHFLDFALRRSFALMMPITIALLVMGDLCINLIYGRGDFTSSSVIGTTQVLWGYTIGLIPMALVMILAPGFYAKGNYSTPTKAAVSSMGLNALLNGVLIAVFGCGAASVAFATSISAWFNLIWLILALLKTDHHPFKHSSGIWSSAGKVLIASIAAGIAVVFFDIFFWNSSSGLEIIQGHLPIYNIPIYTQMFRLVIDGIVFGVILGGIALLLKARDLTHIASTAS